MALVLIQWKFSWKEKPSRSLIRNTTEMTISESVQLVTTTCSAAAVVLLAWQIRESRRIAIIQNSLTCFDQSTLRQAETELRKHLTRVIPGWDWQKIISHDEAQAILGDDEAAMAVWDYLNLWERLCVAINFGAVDEKMCVRRFGTILSRVYNRHEEVINLRRIHRPSIYQELEITYKRWEKQFGVLPRHIPKLQ